MGIGDKPAALGGLSEDTAAAPPPEDAEGFSLDPATAVIIGTMATGLMTGIMAQRNAAKNRQFTSEQGQIDRGFSAQQAAITAEANRKARQEANVQNAIGGIGSRAQQGAAAQGSALSNIARLFGGL